MNKVYIDPEKIDYSLINTVAEILSKGGVVALPTETVYGLGVSASNKEALSKLYDLKQRSPDKPFTSVFDDVDKVTNYYLDILPPFGYRLIESFWPGPLTIVYHNKEGNTVGIRVPDNNVIREIIKKLNSPIALPSANRAGQKEAVNAEEVEQTFSEGIDLIVDSGPCKYSNSSTVLDLTAHPFKVLREGSISQTDIIETFIAKRILFVCTGNTCRSPMAEYMFHKYLDEVNPPAAQRYDIISRGIHPPVGGTIATTSAEVLRDQDGLDTSAHIAKKLDVSIIRSSDLIFAMEKSQRDYILKFEPSAEGRVFLLSQFLPSELEERYKDIPDPIGKGRAVYENVYSLIKEAIMELITWA